MKLYALLKPILAAAVGILWMGSALAHGPHEGLDCLGCHDPHYAKAQKLFKVKNEIYPNPRTGKPIEGISALCLGCHNLADYGGAGVKPIYLHMTHPVNVVPNPKIANVPSSLLRDGILQCVSCHDPHPSNPNWRYLRADTNQGGKVGNFCAVCHGSKADKNFYGGELAAGNLPKLFSSMNEQMGAGSYNTTDAGFTTSNPTPNYIVPLGAFENSLAPAYLTAPTKGWVFDVSAQTVPADLAEAVRAGGAAAAKPAAPAAKPAAPAVKPAAKPAEPVKKP